MTVGIPNFLGILLGILAWSCCTAALNCLWLKLLSDGLGPGKPVKIWGTQQVLYWSFSIISTYCIIYIYIQLYTYRFNVRTVCIYICIYLHTHTYIHIVSIYIDIYVVSFVFEVWRSWCFMPSIAKSLNAKILVIWWCLPFQLQLLEGRGCIS